MNSENKINEISTSISSTNEYSQLKNENEDNLEKCNDTHRMTVDEVLDKIGHTRYHIIITIIVALSLASDGVEIYLVYLILPVLRDLYKLTLNQVSFVISCLIMGMAIGSFISGIMINYFGRKNVILSFIFIVSLFGTICVLIENIYWFVFCRFIIGIGVGVLFNTTNSLCEILPTKFREFIMLAIYVSLKLGICFFILVFYLFTLHTDPADCYKLIVIVSCTPMYLCLLLAFLFFDESPRILLLKEKTRDEAFKIIDKITKGSNYTLTESDKRSIINEINAIKEVKDSEEFTFTKFIQHIGILTGKKYLKLFLLVIFLWTFNAVIIFTNNYVLPIMLQYQNNIENFQISFNSTTTSTETVVERNQKVMKLLICNIISIPALIIAGLVIKLPLLGRKYTMAIAFLFQIVFSLLMHYNSEYLYIHSCMIIFSNSFSFDIGKFYTIEAFKTEFRDTAYGISGCFSRMMAAFTPFIANSFFVLWFYGPCYFMAGCGFIGIVISLMLPFDTLNRSLDKDEVEDKTS